MTCTDFRKLLTPWVDGELSPRELTEIEVHLSACAECRQTAVQEKGFVEWLRRSVPRETVPPALRARLLAQARGEDEVVSTPYAPRAFRFRPSLTWVTASAAVLACGFALWAVSLQRLNRVEWCQAFIDDHQEGLLAGVRLQQSTGSPQELAAWFSQKLKTPMTVPNVPETRLLGGRQCVLKGHRVGLALYKVGDQRVSLFLTSKQELRPPGWTLAAGRYHTATEEGFSLAAWEGSGLLNILVAHLPVEQLLEIADRFRLTS